MQRLPTYRDQQEEENHHTQHTPCGEGFSPFQPQPKNIGHGDLSSSSGQHGSLDHVRHIFLPSPQKALGPELP
jgi:hypothetical protein